MTDLVLSETKTVVDPALTVAHLVLKVADLKSSCQFYSNLGLPPFFIEEKVAIIELRGGTHLVLLEVDQLAGEGIAESLTGQFHKRFSERFDLMIKGKDLNGTNLVDTHVELGLPLLIQRLGVHFQAQGEGALWNLRKLPNFRASHQPSERSTAAALQHTQSFIQHNRLSRQGQQSAPREPM
jgi:hypothetical protein